MVSSMMKGFVGISSEPNYDIVVNAAVIIGIILIVLLLGVLAKFAFYDHVSTTNKPPYKLISFLVKCKLINFVWLVLAEEQREKNGLQSLFNNGEGLYYECDNHCESKNEIQLNYIAQMKGEPLPDEITKEGNGEKHDE